MMINLSEALSHRRRSGSARHERTRLLSRRITEFARHGPQTYFRHVLESRDEKAGGG